MCVLLASSWRVALLAHLPYTAHCYAFCAAWLLVALYASLAAITVRPSGGRHDALRVSAA